MRLYLILVLGLVGCLATEEPINFDTPEDLSEEDEALKRSTGPSFEEIKREFESHGILQHPSVIGLFPRGQEPIHKRALNVSRIVPSYRPICPQVDVTPIHYHVGYSASLVVKNIRCPLTRCAVCGNKFGLCKLQYTYITPRVVYRNPFGKPPGWTWYWASLRIPACCQCFYR